MNNNLKRRLYIVVQGKKTIEIIDMLADKFFHYISENDDNEAIDSIIKKEFDKVRQDIFRDLDEKKIQLEKSKTDAENDRYSKLARDHSQKLNARLKDIPPNERVLIAEDMLAILQSHDIVRNDTEVKSFETSLEKLSTIMRILTGMTIWNLA